MNFLLFAISSLVVFSDNSLLLSQLKNVHEDFVHLITELRELTTEENIDFISELMKKNVKTLDEFLESGRLERFSLENLTRLIDNFKNMKYLERVQRILVLGTENFGEKLDEFLRSGSLTIKEVSELRELFDDRNLTKTDWENISQRQKEEFYNEYVSSLQEEEQITYTTIEHNEAKEFVAYYQRDEL